jgi:NAD(P)-dependent dehydrogenase (short-subunit alcohol dehydrogenase family)
VPKTILITGASSGFGAMTARVLAEAGHVVYAGMRDVAGSDREAAEALEEYAAASRLTLTGAEEIFAIGDRVGEWHFQRLGLDDLLRPVGGDQ